MKKLLAILLVILALVPIMATTAFASTGVDIRTVDIASTIMTVISIVLAVVSILTIIVGIVVEVLKGLFSKLPTNILAFAVSLIITLVAFGAWMAYSRTPIEWYYVAGAILLGFGVAFSAMFGFDKFQQLITSWKNRKGT